MSNNLIGMTQQQWELIMNHGKRYIPSLLPEDIERFPIGTCFDACAVQAIKKKYFYVEGMARSFKDGRWKLHAWLTDGEYAFDPTWKCIENFSGKEIPFQGEYIGIQMDIMKVARFMAETEYQGVIANRFRNEKLAKKAIGV